MLMLQSTIKLSTMLYFMADQHDDNSCFLTIRLIYTIRENGKLNSIAAVKKIVKKDASLKNTNTVGNPNLSLCEDAQLRVQTCQNA